MVYYGLGRIAARSFVGGLAGSVGRRVGNYRRRRRVRWPTSRNRASNVQRTRTFVKKTRVRGGTRNVRRLWKAVKALQRTSDPDVTLRDVIPATNNVPNDADGFCKMLLIGYQTTQTALLALGDQYRIKSFNEQLTFRMSTNMGNNQTNAPNIPVHSFARHVRVLYVLTKDETLSVSQLWPVFSGTSPVFTSSGDSIYPSFTQNPGLTYRILYDKTYTVRAGVPTNIFVRIPSSVFYDRGQVKFRQGSGNSLVQQNNYLYRIVLADSLTTNMIGGLSLSLGSFGDIAVVAQSRWKVYDFGRSVSSALAAKASVQDDELHEDDPGT